MRRRRSLLGLATLLAVGATLAGSCSGDRTGARKGHPVPSATPPASLATSTRSGSPQPGGGDDYLALGDSVPFGFTTSGNARDAASFRGYPELAAAELRLRLANASCPGETTASFLMARPRDLCRLWQVAGTMHVPHYTTQLAYALGYLRERSPDTRLVTLTIGANDLLLCDGRGAAACRSPAVAAEVLTGTERRLRTIVADLRAVYGGPLLVVTYYAIDYTDTDQTRVLRLFNAGTSAVVRAAGGAVVDGFEAFRGVARGAGGDPCAAGLLARLPSGRCDIHPSARGSQVLATALVAAYRSVAAQRR